MQELCLGIVVDNKEWRCYSRKENLEYNDSSIDHPTTVSFDIDRPGVYAVI